MRVEVSVSNKILAAGLCQHVLDMHLLKQLTRLFFPPRATSPEVQQALSLIKAIDAGGLPLNPARVNHIARQLGLEVSSKAPMAQTIQRIREALSRGR